MCNTLRIRGYTITYRVLLEYSFGEWVGEFFFAFFTARVSFDSCRVLLQHNLSWSTFKFVPDFHTQRGRSHYYRQCENVREKCGDRVVVGHDPLKRRIIELDHVSDSRFAPSEVVGLDLFNGGGDHFMFEIFDIDHLESALGEVWGYAHDRRQCVLVARLEKQLSV
jgi:hypothetical protein